MLSLSAVSLEQKRYTEAEQACRRSIAVMERFVPASHPDLINAQIGLALILRRSGNSAEAIRVLEQAVRSVGTPTEEHVHLLTMYTQYLGDAGETEKSRRFLLEARRLSEQGLRTSLAGSTVMIGELEGGSAYQSAGR
jgi:tetratricopeptide (TPR) repeat protein